MKNLISLLALALFCLTTVACGDESRDFTKDVQKKAQAAKEKADKAAKEAKAAKDKEAKAAEDKVAGAKKAGEDKVAGAVKAGDEKVAGTVKAGDDKVAGAVKAGDEKVAGAVKAGEEKVAGVAKAGEEEVVGAGDDSAVDPEKEDAEPTLEELLGKVLEDDSVNLEVDSRIVNCNTELEVYREALPNFLAKVEEAKAAGASEEDMKIIQLNHDVVNSSVVRCDADIEIARLRDLLEEAQISGDSEKQDEMNEAIYQQNMKRAGGLRVQVEYTKP